jgi:RNA polymerase sigma-70 factor, ECF subfamily
VMAESDETLAGRCQRDQDAFEELFRRYHRRLYVYARGMLGSAEEAEEVTQDTFVRLFKFAHHFDLRRKFATWFYTIAANQCRNHIRARRDHSVLSLDSDDAPEPADTHSPGPLEVYERERVREKVDQAIEQLPPLYREVLHLRYLEGLSYREIAQALHLTVSAVETRIFRAKGLLRTELASVASEGIEARER